MYRGDEVGSATQAMPQVTRGLSSLEKAANAAGQYIPPTTRQQLEQKKAALTFELEKVNDALAMLDAHPDLEQFTETIRRAQQ